jgi:DNA polymerase III subunit beta
MANGSAHGRATSTTSKTAKPKASGKAKSAISGDASIASRRKKKPATRGTAKPAAVSRITLSRNEVFDEINLAARIIPAKPTIPLIANVLFMAADGRLQVRATNRDLELHSNCEIESSANFSFGVNGRKLREIVALLPVDEFSMCLNGPALRIECETVHYTLPALAPDRFPRTHQQPEKSFVLPPDFRELIRSVLFFVGEEEGNQTYAMNGVKLEVSRDGGLRMIGTDGNALSFAETECEAGSKVDVLLPEQTMAILMKLLEVEGGVMRYGGSIVQFEAGGRVLFSRVMAKGFPDYRKVMPDYQVYATVDRDEFRDAIRRMALCSCERHNGVRVVLHIGGIDMRAVSSDNDEAEDSVSAKLVLECDIKTGLDAKYLGRFLSAAPKGEIRIYFKDGKSAFDLRPGSCDYDFRCLIMPMNLRG